MSRSQTHVASRGSSHKRNQCQRAHSTLRLRSLSTVIASPLKIGFQPTFDSAVLFSLPLRDFGFSSPVIVIVKRYFNICAKLSLTLQFFLFFLFFCFVFFFFFFSISFFFSFYSCPCLFVRFPLLYQGFKGSAERQILAFVGGSLPFFFKNQGLEGQGYDDPSLSWGWSFGHPR